MTEEIAKELFDLLEKSAAEADALEHKQLVLSAELEKLRKKAAAPPLDKTLVERLVDVLSSENYLEPSVSKEAAVSAIMSNPTQVLEFTLNLLQPLPVDGIAVQSKQAAENTGSAKIVILEGRQLVDHDNWSSLLR